MEGTLPLRCCAGRFACRVATWRLHADGRAADLVTEGGEEVGTMRVEHGAPGVEPGFEGGDGVTGLVGVKRVRLNGGV